MDYFIIISNDVSQSTIFSEHDSFNNASNRLLDLFNSLYGQEFSSWKDALKSDLNHLIYVWELTDDVTCFKFREKFYDIVFKTYNKKKGSSLSLNS